MKTRLISAALFCILCFTSPTARAGIVLDYTNDTFFTNLTGGDSTIRQTARNALEAAVADVNAVLNLNLGAITNATANGNSGGGTNVNFNFSLSYGNPTTGAAVQNVSPILPANQIRIFAGVRPQGGGTLAQGGSGGVGVSLSGQIGSGSVQTAFDNAVANSQLRRGDGPTIATLSGTASGGAFAFAVGPTIGSITFDNDVTSGGDVRDPITGDFTGLSVDSDSVLNNFWHFDHTTAVDPSKFDFYSVAIHETLHAIGFGGSQAWQELVSGLDGITTADWLGAEAIAEFGAADGTNLISPFGDHIASGILSTSLLDGSLQEVSLAPTISRGSRRGLTTLDVAFLRDLGFSTNVTAIPEPSSFIAIAGVVGIAAMMRRRKRPAVIAAA